MNLAKKVAVILTFLLTLSACGGGEEADTIAPVISLVGSLTINHEQGTVFTDPGATAIDAVDGPVNVTVTGTVNKDVAGSYQLTYTAVDRAGNRATLTRTIRVADTIAPVITLNGAASLQHEQGQPFQDPGATAVDSVDGVIAVTVSGNVNNDEEGSYNLSYSATDKAGNTAIATRLVTVVAAESEGTDLVVMMNGEVDALWTKGISAFDEAIGWGECNNDGGAACPSIDWQWVNAGDRGQVLQISHANTGMLAGAFIASNTVIDLSDYASGSLVFDLRVVSGDSKITMKLDCVYPCTSGDQRLGSRGATDWDTISIPLSQLVSGGLDLTKVNTGIVIWATDATSTVFQLDNIRFTGAVAGSIPPIGGGNPVDYQLMHFGAGNVSDTINPASYRCVYDYGNWIYNAGIVLPAIDNCNVNTGIPTGTPTKLYPQLTGVAKTRPTATHKWWGSISFLGEMTIGDPNKAAYITPDPIIARISERGVRMMGIPAGMRTLGNDFLYQIPDPFSEVFDGIAVGNTQFNNLQAYLKDHSDGSVTVEWQHNNVAVMEATFVHGSPYMFLQVFQGELVIRTTRENGNEKGTFYQQANHLGVWTSIAGNHNNFLITGEGETTFSNVTSNAITATNAANAFTITYLPYLQGVPADSFTDYFAAKARNVVQQVTIDYSIDRQNNSVTIEHSYLDQSGNAVDTIAGLQPMHWKNAATIASPYQVRSARGITKFTAINTFRYSLPYIGLLPGLPTLPDSFEQTKLMSLINEFISEGPTSWNDRTDAYWAGKNYGKVSELIMLAEAIGMSAEATLLREWLKDELEDWFTADTSGGLDTMKYFVYDKDWHTVLAIEESFASHQELNDHHFHYGYLVRAAAEICRVDTAWCSQEQFGPMIELLIRDFAAGRDDSMFPYLRHFDPANGFSWASGKVNFVRGNNNESTSEAANAYGAMVLYGMITNNTELTERGMYLHASTTAAYWEYWNNIDRFNRKGAEADNFPATYQRMTTSIIWGDGAVFSTWFSGAFAHILGIQGLPSNALNLHIGLHADYLVDYVALGLSESANGKPSGLIPDQWRDIWWNIWAMTDANAAIADYETAAAYEPEAGETKAHTYHWLHTFKELGHIATGTGALTADYPVAVAFNNQGRYSYVVYNFSEQPIVVRFSDGQIVEAAPRGFTVVRN